MVGNEPTEQHRHKKNMSHELFSAQIKGLEAQLAALKARVKRLTSPTVSDAFSALEGILASAQPSNEDDIAAVEYRVTWDEDGEQESEP